LKRVTLKDIAEQVKVSKTAVSKVLNGRAIRISPEKREKILLTARRLGYRPNFIARSLQNNATATIGIVVPDISNLYYPDIIRSVEMKLSSQGYKTIICNTEDDPQRERALIEDLLSRQVDGFMIAPANGEENLELFRQIHAGGRPFVLIDIYIPGEPFHYIVSDNREGARAGVRRLAREGTRRIAYLGDRARNGSLDDRLRGVGEEAAARGLAFDQSRILLCEHRRESVAASCTRLLASGAEGLGLFLESNRFLMGLLDACLGAGIAVPDDLKIIGFDPFVYDIAYPRDFRALGVLRGPVPVLKQSMERMGELASEYLMSSFEKQLEGDWQLMLPVELIEP